jgi:UDP-GlcNAc:undecaprenyl-phosphate/decaprenyl-phosphate GlcNAc-1-phosphate transferase
MTTYFAVYFGSLLLALIITPVVIKLAHCVKAVSKPGIRDVHTKPIPRIGGAAIYFSAIVLIIAVLFINNNVGQAFRDKWLQLLTMFGSATLIFFIGLADDLRGMPARIKFLAELFGAGLLCTVGVRISSIGITGTWTLHLGSFGCILTILWIVGITNAVNLSDGLDGLAAGISAITCGVIAIFAIKSGSIIMAVLMLALLGSLSGFLFFNFNPAKVFMGDCGSLFLGFTIASTSVMCATKSSALVGLALPALALGIPIFDTLFSMLRRFLERRGMFSPDRGHFHHRLIDLGLHQKQVVIIIYAITLLSAGLGMFMMITRNSGSIIIFACILILIMLVFRVVGSVHLHETISGLQDKYRFANQRKLEQQHFEQAQLHFRSAANYDQWWQAVCNAAQRMDFAWVSLKTQDKGGNITTEIWRSENGLTDIPKLMIMTIPFNRGDLSHEFEIAVSVNGSYESAGRRATLFNRLIDEHEIQGIRIGDSE